MQTVSRHDHLSKKTSELPHHGNPNPRGTISEPQTCGPRSSCDGGARAHLMTRLVDGAHRG
jgi:hypothetical protein